MRIGIRAHDFGAHSPHELASRIAAAGFECVHLAPGKAILGVEMAPGRISAELARDVRDAFGRRGIGVSVLGCYINPIHPDSEERSKLLGLFKEYVRLAESFGSRIVALETGSLNADYAPHPENGGEHAFQELVRSLRELAAEAQRHGVTVCAEPASPHVISTPERMRRLLDVVGSAPVGVLFDPVNLMTAANHRNQRKIMAECLDLCGSRIAAMHAKDFIVEADRVRAVPAGQGLLDYPYLFDQLKHRGLHPDVILEGVSPDSAEQSRRFLLECAG